MNYMNHYTKIDDLITLLGDFPLPVGDVTREGDTLRYTSDVVEVVSVFEKHPSGVTKRSDSVRNVAERPITIRTALSKFVLNAGRFEVYTQYDENNAEGQDGWVDLVTEIAAHGKELRCSFENAPFMAVYNTGSGRGLAFHIFENCLWTLRTRKVIRQRGQRKTVTVEAGMDSSNLSVTLQPGEVLQLPQILCYTFRSKTDMDAYKLHRYCNEKFMNKPLPVLYNTWMSKFDDISYDLLAEQVKVAKRLGVEYFTIDAGWFGIPFKWSSSVGDWEEFQDVGMAGRMKEFADLVRANGIKFGLWFEIERASLECKAYKAHPEYYLVEDDKAFIDFANPEARAFAFKKVADNVRKYGIEYIKFDFNATLTFDNRAAAFRPYFEGYREFIKQVKETFPGIYLEGCASGGMRIAPATLEFFDSYWLTDQQDLHDQMEIYKSTVKRMPNRALTTWITVQSLPNFGPRTVGGTADKILTGDGTWNHIERTTPSYLKASMLGAPIGLSCDLTMLTEEVLQAMQSQIEKFKAEREFWNVSECHILEDTDAAMVLQYNDPATDKIKIHVYIKKFCQNAVTVYPFCTAGAEYVMEDGTVLCADQLVEEGLEIPVSTRNSAVEVALTKK